MENCYEKTTKKRASNKIIDAHFLIIIAKKLIKIKARRRYLLYFLCYSLTFDVRFATIRSWNILIDALKLSLRCIKNMATKLMDVAKKNKSDEFYTQLVDIENELKHYKEQLSGKIIFCNCDDPYESNFFKYFAMNFNILGLKKLIATCYDSSPIAYSQLSIFPDIQEKKIPNTNRRAYKIEICEVEDYNQDGAVDLSDVEYLLKNKKNIMTLLNGNGDFRSEECIGLLKEADIVVTNPPFSLFREYVEQLESLVKNKTNSRLSLGFVLFLFGAGGRTRTGTVSLPVDFESTTSANSITPAQIAKS